MDLEIKHEVACGLDVHSATIAACLARTGPKGGPNYDERTFPTTQCGLKQLREWLVAGGCQVVGMEATGVYWMPVYAALEDHLALVVGNPGHMKNLRGHKTDRKDAKWIAGLVRHGLIRPSYVPTPEFRDARELTRSRRQFIEARTAVRNEILRNLASKGLPLAKVLSNVFGVSGMGILAALAEIGVDMSHWPTERHLSAWAGVAPGSRESGGKRMSSATRKGNVHMTTILVEAAGAAVKAKGCHLATVFHRLRSRMGYKKAVVAIARKLLVIIYHLLSRGTTYQEPQPQAASDKAKRRAIDKRVKDLNRLGFTVVLTPVEANA